MEKQKHFWQREDTNGQLCDEHVCSRFDDDPEFMMGLSEREFLYFVLGGFAIGAFVGFLLWYGLFYVFVLKPYGFTKGVPVIISIVAFCFGSGYFAHKRALRYVSSTKRGKPRGYLFHLFAEELNTRFGIKPKYNTHKGSWDIRR